MNKDSHLEEIENTLDDRLETWRPVIGFEGRYEVSDAGRVRSLVYRGAKGVPVIMLQQKDRLGYWRMVLGNDRVNVRVHSMVAAAFLGPRPDGYDVNHKNGVKSDNRLDNLEYCTESENTRHSFANGLQVAIQGEDHYNSRISDDQVREILLLRNSGISQRQIAERFGVRQQYISKVMLGKIRKAVTS